MQDPSALKAELCIGRGGRSFFPGLSNTPFIARTGRAHLKPKVIFQCLEGVLNLSYLAGGQRLEVFHSCVSARETLP